MTKQASTEKENQTARPPKAMVEIAREKCKGCEICLSVCPQGCLQLDRTVFNSKGFHPAVYSYQGSVGHCTACGLCYMVCPDYAVRSVKIYKEKE